MNIPNINLTFSEIISLYLLKNEMNLFRHTNISRSKSSLKGSRGIAKSQAFPADLAIRRERSGIVFALLNIEKQIQSVYERLSCFLPENFYKQLDKIGTLFVPSSKFAKDYKGREEIIGQLTNAVLEQKTCYVKYHSFGDDKIRNFAIDPLHFFEKNGGLYLMANMTRFKEIRTLAIERIRKITGTDLSFEYPADFDPDKLLETAFDIVYDDPITVRIRFSSNQARYIKERKWSKTQRIEDQPDNSLILSMKTSGWWDVRKWVLSYGADAVVLEPESLREEIIEELRVNLEKYEKSLPRQIQPQRDRQTG